ncbi:hypothetical protein PQ460_07875 [Paenibacillus sp. KACC 21273]|uniref:hypothetical protein n=1 Tax=Paenibacillus sp. KACC 21273 TaxID=3025665 RepID=UPI002366F53A|nr:hypothetical protein [Paenibacillus sp. KACC 21273]WDF52315.1 hypothetical protein PQ460_07875 [Paenibacillus sp. KACC 21273]
MDQSQEQSSQEQPLMTFSDEQQLIIDGLLNDAKTQWEADILNPIMAERDALKPLIKSEAENQLEHREQELFQKEISFELKQSGLYDFAEFFNVKDSEQLQEKIIKLNTILNERQIKNSYVPENHKSQSQYEQAQSKGNVQDMISAKLSKVFGK